MTEAKILEVASSMCKLKKTGLGYLGLCPFHKEMTPSFYVDPESGTYKCFCCGESGNAVSFLMKLKGMTYDEAVKALGHKDGCRPMGSDIVEGRTLKELYKKAAVYYLYNLNKDGSAYKYLTDRGLSIETIKKFGLGYAPKKGGLYKKMKGEYPKEVLEKSELFNMQYGLDKFWNRVMFPIFDLENKVVAFGGRVMGDGTPKYLNSNETPIFDKSGLLYGLNFAKDSKKKYMLLCEGYMDVISLHQAGFDNAVASLGTALTTSQAELLAGFTKHVVITYDSDEAGVNAAKRAVPMLKKAGITPRILDMKPYKDPDEFIKALGKEEYDKRIAASVPADEWLIKNEPDRKKKIEMLIDMLG